MRARWRLPAGVVIALLLFGTVVAAACGARSDLKAPFGAQPGADAGVDAEDAPTDAAEDVAEDAAEDVPEDVPDDCTPDATYIYVVTSQNNLLAYKPLQNQFEHRGVLDCPSGGETPFSMAVARTGTAHVVYGDGVLYRVSAKDASCETTSFFPGQQGFWVFGMGYGANQDDDGETLYVAEISFGDPSLGLGRIDTDTYQLSYIGPFSDNPGNALELTPTGGGPLYGYFLNSNGQGGTLVEIDTATAEIVSTIAVPAGTSSSALAVAWWGGDFYIFTTNGPTTDVNRFNPIDQSTTVVNTLDQTIVGAGVSTCAPDR